MTKSIIIIGIVLGALLITGVILSLVAPKRISITSKQFIKASKEEVYDQIRFLNNYPKWSPFIVQDPEQRHSVSGVDGEVGATFSWEGVKEKSKGFQRIVSLKSNEQVDISCTITEPFQAQPSFSYMVKEKENGVEVALVFDVELPVPANIFGMLFGLKHEMAKTNQNGLDLLKKVSEETIQAVK